MPLPLLFYKAIIQFPQPLIGFIIYLRIPEQAKVPMIESQKHIECSLYVAIAKCYFLCYRFNLKSCGMFYTNHSCELQSCMETLYRNKAPGGDNEKE